MIIIPFSFLILENLYSNLKNSFESNPYQIVFLITGVPLVWEYARIHKQCEIDGINILDKQW